MDRPFMEQAQRWIQHGLDLLFPPRCAGCQRSGHLLCPACLHDMRPMAPPFCRHCGQPLADEAAPCISCQYHRLKLDGVRCAQIYQGMLRETIHAMKYAGQPRLAEPLGLLLARAFRWYDLHADALVPLPLHPERERQRGYNHATLLARRCATTLKIPCLEQLVVRARPTLAQVGLSVQQRQENVSGAFALAPAMPPGKITGSTLVLIDDVCTTGATLEACADPLYAAGARQIWGLVLGRPGNSAQNASKDVL